MANKIASNTEELDTRAMRELLRIVEGKRSTKNNLLGSARFAKASADELAEIPTLEYRSRNAPGPLNRLQVANLTFVQSDWNSVLDLAARGLPVLWVASPTWVDRQVANRTSRSTLPQRDAEELLATAKMAWQKLRETKPEELDPEFVELTELLLSHTNSDNFAIALPFAYALLEKVMVELLRREGIFSDVRGLPNIYGRSQRMRTRGSNFTTSAVNRLRRALIGSTVIGLYEREAFSDGHANRMSGTRHFVVHALSPQQLQWTYVVVTAAAVISTIYEIYKD